MIMTSPSVRYRCGSCVYDVLASWPEHNAHRESHLNGTFRPAPPPPLDVPCHYCKIREANTRDHIVPKSRGGRDAQFNVVPACQRCNVAKAASWPTCECEVCVASIALHAAYGIVEIYQDSQCPSCGLVTMTPWDCPWCVRVEISVNPS